jgi:hypothetical protein
MNGKKLIENICLLLDKKNKRYTDSNIIIELREMNDYDLKILINM